jgi:hypothetical protein
MYTYHHNQLLMLVGEAHATLQSSFVANCKTLYHILSSLTDSFSLTGVSLSPSIPTPLKTTAQN